jgi:hypothetical protein
MGSSEAFIRATVNRISARLGHGLADAAAEIAVLAQDAPERLRQEWELFQEEVQAEAERLEHVDAPAPRSPGSGIETTDITTDSQPSSPQDLVDRLRASVAEINSVLEARS